MLRSIRSLPDNGDEFLVSCAPKVGPTFTAHRFLLQLSNRRNVRYIESNPDAPQDNWAFVLSIKLTELKTKKSRRFLVDRLLEMASSVANVQSGFISCYDPDHTLAHSLFTTFATSPCLWTYVQQESVWWHQDTDRLNSVRGVFWGNYFGPHLTKKLSAEPSVFEQIPKWRCVAQDVDCGIDADVRHFKNGAAFISITDDVEDSRSLWGLFCDKYGRFNEFAAWLHIQLRKRNMLA